MNCDWLLDASVHSAAQMKRERKSFRVQGSGVEVVAQRNAPRRHAVQQDELRTNVFSLPLRSSANKRALVSKKQDCAVGSQLHEPRGGGCLGVEGRKVEARDCPHHLCDLLCLHGGEKLKPN